MKYLIFDLDDTLYSTQDRLDDVTPNYETMRLFPGVLEVLNLDNVTNILVTQGDADIQNKKIDILGIRKYFTEIHVVPKPEDKERIFKDILKHHSITNTQDVYVIGDRRDIDIRYGKMLGCKTVLVEGWKYKDIKPKDKYEIADIFITSFDMLQDILVLMFA